MTRCVMKSTDSSICSDVIAKTVFCGIVCITCFLSAHAADGDTDTEAVVRPVTAAYTVEAGTSHLADTYLTPLKYSGWSMGLGYERMQAMRFDPERWVMQLKLRVEIDRTENPVRNAVMWYGGVDFSWGMMYRWRNILPNLTIGAGGAARMDLGCLYNARNGNNPASARAAVTVGMTGYVAWQTRLWRIPVTLRYQPALPVVGAFFSPDYGELYYEIYLGNRSGLAHCAWWGSYFAMENLVTADMHFGATSVRIGYRNNTQSARVNNITSRHITHCAVIGVAGEWISLARGRGIPSRTRIVTALY